MWPPSSGASSPGIVGQWVHRWQGALVVIRGLAMVGVLWLLGLWGGVALGPLKALLCRYLFGLGASGTQGWCLTAPLQAFPPLGIPAVSLGLPGGVLLGPYARRLRSLGCASGSSVGWWVMGFGVCGGSVGTRG